MTGSSCSSWDTSEALPFDGTLLDLLPDGFVILDRNGRLLDINDRFAELFGYAREDAVGRHITDFDAAHDLDQAGQRIKDIRANPPAVFETAWRCADGSHCAVEVSASYSDVRGGLIFALLRDIRTHRDGDSALRQTARQYLATARHYQAEAKRYYESAKRYRESNRFYRALQETTQDGFVVANSELQIVEANDAYCTLTGWSQDDLLGMSMYSLDVPHAGASARDRAAAIREADTLVFETKHRRRDGSLLPVEVSASYSSLDGGSYFCFVRDISERTRHREELEFLAFRDELTGLPNQRLFLKLLDDELARARLLSTRLAVCCLDLDDFQRLNRGSSREYGDELLKQVANALRTPSMGLCHVARVGGDEFALVWVDVATRRELELKVARVLDAVSALGTETRAFTATCGLTTFPEDDSHADQLLRNAYHALFQAKRLGKNCCLQFDPGEHRAQQDKATLLREVTAAMLDEQLQLYLQPRVNLDSGAVVSAEVLIRWKHPQRGLLLPGRFLPALRGTDLEMELDCWVLERALELHMAFRSQGIALPLSVNISPHSLQQAAFPSILQRLLEHYPADVASKLELEVLETAAFEKADAVAMVMKQCRALGVTFALDDFGTGYASLTYFFQLPIQVLKVDQGFVRSMVADHRDHALVEGVFRLAEAVGCPIVAEGVESPETILLLYLTGYRLVQGYSIARPMPAESFPAWLEVWRTNDVCEQIRQAASVEAVDDHLKLALFSHRRWLSAFRARLVDNGIDARAAADQCSCPLQAWLLGPGEERYGESERFREVIRMHEQVHASAMHMADLAATEARTALTQSLREFERLCGRFESTLCTLESTCAAPPS